MLFNAYTGGRPAEFVHASKGKASLDPLGEADETSKHERLREVTGKDYDDESDAGDGPEYDGDELFDDDDQDLFDNYDPSDKNMNMDASTHEHSMQPRRPEWGSRKNHGFILRSGSRYR